MGEKETLQKELDFLLEKIRFWRYVILAVVSGILGILLAISQNKMHTNGMVITLLVFGVMTLIIAVSRIGSTTNEYKNLLSELRKEK